MQGHYIYGGKRDRKQITIDGYLCRQFFYFFKNRCVLNKTFTGLFTVFNHFTPFPYKPGLVIGLIDRAFKINNTSLGFHVDFGNIKDILQKDPHYVIYNIVKTFIYDFVKTFI